MIQADKCFIQTCYFIVDAIINTLLNFTVKG